ncbi:conserved hypothetical protein [Nautilia profundicola AmH]|uniref:Uncharacterized protein n=1 Tax=Nautilia profundicola (strain ATCC BAA-1463 / DSM 18972 / AmH) TaxID=598659 RepID=B9L613_NAUPA|nr:hypothetical protein [Nautilia profundicola]ACM93474.1 conserved hypothetical protein [Nautilia profundicola AmH]
MPRLIPAYIEFEFSEYNDKLKEEFDKLGSESDDPIGQYIKLAKARGETKETDPVLLELLIALHRKVDELTAYVKNEKKELIKLDYKTEIEKIGFEYFEIKENLFKPKMKYYGRMSLPVFPPRDVPVVFEAENEKLAKILLMHERDVKDYNAFIMARERAIIREMKGKNG